MSGVQRDERSARWKEVAQTINDHVKGTELQVEIDDIDVTGLTPGAEPDMREIAYLVEGWLQGLEQIDAPLDEVLASQTKPYEVARGGLRVLLFARKRAAWYAERVLNPNPPPPADYTN